MSCQNDDDEPPETDDLKEQEAAAVKIQAVFRGQKSRKQLQEKEVSSRVGYMSLM